MNAILVDGFGSRFILTDGFGVYGDSRVIPTILHSTVEVIPGGWPDPTAAIWLRVGVDPDAALTARTSPDPEAASWEPY